MKIFLDTSALAKRYIEEPGSDELENLLHSAVKEVTVSTLALPEFSAAISRKVRNKELSDEMATDAMKEIEIDWNGLFIKIPLFEDLAKQAASLTIQFPLKGADAVHLVSAVASGADLFIASDRQLISAAEQIGLQCFNPVAGFFQSKKD
ncbi:MAG: type II toxin-antitoxin system VapC family toxin [Candidatus Aminicenantes bacterium]|nr:type II toxin-antitoxin system VapC family toxin [Candidatus Aminicenantes bacterium]